MNEKLHNIKASIITESMRLGGGLKKVGKALQRESKETRITSMILMKIMKGKEVTPEEITFLKEQSADLGKAFTIIGLQAVPGLTVNMVLRTLSDYSNTNLQM